jgi:predicted RNase H-like HicB family nuclease
MGATEDEALDRARDLLATSIEMILEDGESPPPAPPANGRPLVNASLDQPAKG